MLQIISTSACHFLSAVSLIPVALIPPFQQRSTLKDISFVKQAPFAASRLDRTVGLLVWHMKNGELIGIFVSIIYIKLF